jgi:putative transcriptional regulator
MKKEIFDELIASIEQGGAILRGERKPSREFNFDASKIKEIRQKHNLSQSQFASLLRISPDTVQNWEQGRRRPAGASLTLLQVAAKHPEAVFDSVNKPVIFTESRRSGRKAK